VIAEPSIRLIRSHIGRGYISCVNHAVTENAAELEREYVRLMGLAS
jgi:hypothetical protein